MTHHHESSDHDPLAALVRSAAPEAFDAGFSERVLARLRTDREPALSTMLERQFLRIVPLLAAASLVLAAYNWWGARETSSSAIDAALNLPQVTLGSAYAPSLLYGTAANATEAP
jgi:hypothetical protein